MFLSARIGGKAGMKGDYVRFFSPHASSNIF